ncbi:MAG: phosphonate ABC transporter ATP-binding protein [Methylococcales bacterium]|nr:phosphonate ABC transporter ATP-binding protein [Methylococcales bacterium]
MSAIILKQVGKTYANGFKALNGIDLTIEQGQFVVVLGPSGAGKSTLLRVINAMDPANSGEVTVDGELVQGRNLRKIRARIGMVFQHFNLVDRLNVMTNVLTGRLAYRHWLGSLLQLFPKSDFELAEAALAEVGLVDKAWQRADQLSGGQQQRVAIARALTQQPRVILADEPVASLDPKSSEDVLALLKKICVEKNITVIANLHQIEFAKIYADRIVALNAGRVVFDGPPDDLTDHRLNQIYGLDAKESQHDRDELALADA